MAASGRIGVSRSGHDDRMLFRRAVLDAIVAGDVRFAFRRWDRPRIRPGTRLRTAVGVLDVVAVQEVDPDRVTAAEARAAGATTVREVTASRGDRPLYRVELRYAGEDPRGTLRDAVPGAEDLTALRTRLGEIDRRSRRGPWTRETLGIIAGNPGRRAPDLAAELGRETLSFKRDVRVLKELGLTESLAVGYRLSPRGEAVVSAGRRGAAGTRPAR